MWLKYRNGRKPEDNEIATIENIFHVAMLLFVGYIDAATSMSESCGGGFILCQVPPNDRYSHYQHNGYMAFLQYGA